MQSALTETEACPRCGKRLPLLSLQRHLMLHDEERKKKHAIDNNEYRRRRRLRKLRKGHLV
jgi:hypothetical protein